VVVAKLTVHAGTGVVTPLVPVSPETSLYRSGVEPTQPVSSVAPSISTAQNGLQNFYSEGASFSAEQTLPLQTTLQAVVVSSCWA
jgi:hypothetical protein